jgi:hypothetical protein
MFEWDIVSLHMHLSTIYSVLKETLLHFFAYFEKNYQIISNIMSKVYCGYSKQAVDATGIIGKGKDVYVLGKGN